MTNKHEFLEVSHLLLPITNARKEVTQVFDELFSTKEALEKREKSFFFLYNNKNECIGHLFDVGLLQIQSADNTDPEKIFYQGSAILDVLSINSDETYWIHAAVPMLRNLRLPGVKFDVENPVLGCTNASYSEKKLYTTFEIVF